MSEKITGYLLLIFGLVVILGAGFSVYQVFTKQTKPVQLFNFSGVSLNMGSLLGEGDNLPAEQRAAFEKQKASIKPQEIISADMINETSNIGAHLFLMGFIVSIGYRIASLGVQMLRAIVVKPIVKTSAPGKSILDPHTQ